ncbi:lipoyl(octanoyl) transferase LipB [Rhodococcus hoagii]|nr:lipoyl(octanoyl) transferase LipB [Prescottella equi]
MSSVFAAATSTARSSSQPMVVEQLGRIDYMEAWDRQRVIATARADDEGADTLLLLEHPAVYTAGRRTAPEDRPADGTPVIDVDRGGKITWHGPGQLVGYPIVKLAEPVDVVGYVRRIEEALIAVCTDLGLTCGRVEGRSGVWLPAALVDGNWLPERKVPRSGCGCSAASRCTVSPSTATPNSTGFDNIVPCGITDAGVTTLSARARARRDRRRRRARRDRGSTGGARRRLAGDRPRHRTSDLRHGCGGPEFTTVRFG